MADEVVLVVCATEGCWFVLQSTFGHRLEFFLTQVSFGTVYLCGIPEIVHVGLGGSSWGVWLGLGTTRERVPEAFGPRAPDVWPHGSVRSSPNSLGRGRDQILVCTTTTSLNK